MAQRFAKPEIRLLKGCPKMVSLGRASPDFLVQLTKKKKKNYTYNITSFVPGQNRVSNFGFKFCLSKQ